MLVLKKGSFLGQVSHLYAGHGVTVSITDYQQKDSEASCIHYHEHPNLYFVLKGGSLEKKGSEVNEQLAGDLRFYFAGESHQNIRTYFPSTSINLEIEYALLNDLDLTEETVKWNISRPGIKFNFLKIWRELRSNDLHSAESLDMLLFNSINQFSEPPGGKMPEWLMEIRQLLNDRWNEKISLQEISGIVGIHPVTISKYFPHFFHCTLGEYMRILKIQKAIPLITSTRRSLTEIAYECGFADQSHFLRAFKQFTGFKPSLLKRLPDIG